MPEPAKGVPEMVRVVAPGGTVAAYAWDMLGGGFPGEPVLAEMRAMGVNHPHPPSAGASRVEALRQLWTAAGLESVETREITGSRTYDDFETFWRIVANAASIRPVIAGMRSADANRLEARVRPCLPSDASGRISCVARANAVKGRVPD